LLHSKQTVNCLKLSSVQFISAKPAEVWMPATSDMTVVDVDKSACLQFVAGMHC